ncbi:MAG: cobalt ECF transporter T component CbiQ [Pirellulales bacterium]|nr:cobalt ECF transporter T component CbiQ [Pirellulales bacterium]
MIPTIQPAAGSASAYLSGADPRARIVFAAAFAAAVAWSSSFPALGTALAASIFASFFSGVRPAAVFKRLLPLNVVFLCLFLILPFTAPGRQAAMLYSLSLSREGFLLAAAIALKGNAIALMMIALFGSMETTTLGHALSHLGVPRKLALLLLFTARYVAVLEREYSRLRAAMRVRAFRPGMNRHTYRAFGFLAGMLLVRSLDRSERILAAMKCRGFAGRFYLLDHFAFTKKDLPFCAAAVVVLALTVGMELWRKR